MSFAEASALARKHIQFEEDSQEWRQRFEELYPGWTLMVVKKGKEDEDQEELPKPKKINPAVAAISAAIDERNNNVEPKATAKRGRPFNPAITQVKEVILELLKEKGITPTVELYNLVTERNISISFCGFKQILGRLRAQDILLNFGRVNGWGYKEDLAKFPEIKRISSDIAHVPCTRKALNIIIEVFKERKVLTVEEAYQSALLKGYKGQRQNVGRYIYTEKEIFQPIGNSRYELVPDKQ